LNGEGEEESRYQTEACKRSSRLGDGCLGATFFAQFAARGRWWNPFRVQVRPCERPIVLQASVRNDGLMAPTFRDELDCVWWITSAANAAEFMQSGIGMS